jgi:cytoskeletal protein RodZ
MGQGVGGVSEAPAVGAVEGREPIGRYLAQQRRLRGIDLDEIAARTRIPRRSLERLEAGAFDHSPDGFSRGFVRTVAEAIGLDPDDAVARMMPEPDAQVRGGPRWGRVAGALGGFAALVLGVLFVADRALAPAASPAESAAGLPLRRDYVRELAEARGIDASALSARDAVIAFRPAPAVEPIAQAETSSGAPAAVAAQSAPLPAPAASKPAPAPGAPFARAPVAAPAPPASTPRADVAPPAAAPGPAPLTAEASQPTLEASASDSATPPGEPAALAPERDAEAHD